MIKKEITYVDFNGVEQKEVAYFHLSKIEIMEMEAGTEGGLEKHLKAIVETKDNVKIVETFKNIILAAYGKKSEDGRRFSKDPALTAEFADSIAFEELYMEIASDAEVAAAFVNGVVPKTK